MSAASDRPEADDKLAAVTAGSASLPPAQPGAVTSALRPRATPPPEPLPPEMSERVLEQLAAVTSALAPGASESQVLDAFAAALVDLLPGRAITLRPEPLAAPDAPAASVTDPPAALGSPGERSSHVKLSAAAAAPPPARVVDVPALVDGVAVASIAIGGASGAPDLSLERAVVTRVAPFLAAALRAARAGHDAGLQLDKLKTQLVQAERLVTVGRYTAEIVHEFNNPLSAIVAYSDLLAQRPALDAADRRRIERVGEAATRVQGLARRLLAYARAVPEPAAELVVADVLDQAVLFCEHVVAQHGVAVERAFDEALPAVFGVRAELVQVFVNLITNACHAVGPRDGRVRITARTRGPDAVCVTMEDNGHGIEPRHLPHIFDPFFTTKVEAAGTGLGLSIVRYILEGHGARWRVESEPGRGTRFEIDLPVTPR